MAFDDQLALVDASIQLYLYAFSNSSEAWGLANPKSLARMGSRRQAVAQGEGGERRVRRAGLPSMESVAA